jgi:hypothetical protein
MLSPYYWPEWTPTSLALLDYRDNDPGIPPDRLARAVTFLTFRPSRKPAPEQPPPPPSRGRAQPKPSRGNAPPANVVATEYAEVGKTVRLGVTTDGSPPLQFEWLKDGKSIANGTDKILTLENVSEADAGAYVCVVRNSAGERASQLVQLVIEKPQ